MTRGLRLLGVAAICAATAGALAAGAQASTYSNPTPINIPDHGPATPYPSTIGVSGLPGTVGDVNVTLNGLFHSCFSDLWFVVVGPGGQKSLLMSHAGSDCGNDPPGPVTITFDDEAATAYPCDAAPSGAFKPVADACNFNEDVDLPGPAPAGPYPASLTAQDGGTPNGSWSLFVFDQYTGDGGPINAGWTLDLLPTVSCAGKPATVNANVGTAGPDNLVGTPGPDVILGLGGKDTIRGMGGRDVICGGSGKDKLIGGAGKDICIGGKAKDIAKSCETEKSV